MAGFSLMTLRRRAEGVAASVAMGLLGSMVIAGQAMASAGAAPTLSINLPDSVETPNPFNVIVTAECAEDHPDGGTNPFCDLIGKDITVGTLAVQQVQVGGEPAACGADGATFVSVSSGTPNGSGQRSYNFDTTGLVGLFGFRASYTGTGNTHDPVSADGECKNLTVTGFEADVSKELVSGPLDDNFDDTFAAGYDMSNVPPDAGVIGAGLLHTQRYAVDIAISGNGLDGAVVSDVFGADFDLDPDGEDADNSAGVPDASCADGTCDGWSSSDAACVVTHTRPASAFKVDNQPAKQPEFILITLDGEPAGGECTVTVWVKTVLNPGVGNVLYEPTSCRVVGGTTNEPIFDTFTLNEGLKVFGPDGYRVSGPDGSLQLTMNECGVPLDTDNDGIPDDIDPDDDNDGFSDFEEAEAGTDGKDENDFPTP